MRNRDKPASAHHIQFPDKKDGELLTSYSAGLTKREECARSNLAGLLPDPNMTIEIAVKLAIAAADLLFDELEKGETNE